LVPVVDSSAIRSRGVNGHLFLRNRGHDFGPTAAPFGAPGLLLLGEQEHAAVQASLLVVVRRQR
jgi:hypothetical protein